MFANDDPQGRRIAAAAAGSRLSGAAGSSGGARAGSFMHSRIFRATLGSSMAAMRRSLDLQRGQHRASISPLIYFRQKYETLRK